MGPEASGEFPVPIQERLKQIGSWMKVNGDAIYGTIASPSTGYQPEALVLDTLLCASPG